MRLVFSLQVVWDVRVAVAQPTVWFAQMRYLLCMTFTSSSEGPFRSPHPNTHKVAFLEFQLMNELLD